MSSAIINGTMIYIGIGIGANVLSYFIPACKSDQQCAAPHALLFSAGCVLAAMLSGTCADERAASPRGQADQPADLADGRVLLAHVRPRALESTRRARRRKPSHRPASSICSMLITSRGVLACRRWDRGLHGCAYTMRSGGTPSASTVSISAAVAQSKPAPHL